MSYYIQNIYGELVIPKENIDKALVALNEVLRTDGDACEGIEEYTSSLGFANAEFDCNGNLCISDYYDDCRYLEESLSVLVPFVRPDSRMAWIGEDGTIFVWTFEDYKLNERKIDPENLFLL